MKHSISELANKVKVMYEKAMALENLTNSPIGQPEPQVVKYAIEDIQALAREIANDLDR